MNEKKCPIDIIGKNYGDYTVISYEGKDATSHKYKIKFNATGNTVIRTRESIRKGDLKDVKAKVAITKKAAAIKTIDFRKKLNTKFEDLEIDTIYGVYQKGENVLSLDQSSTTTGFSIYKNNVLHTYGCLKQYDGNGLNMRIHLLLKDIDTLVKDNNIKHILLEDIYLGQNMKTFKALAQLIGVIAEYCITNKIGITLIPAVMWKGYFNINKAREISKQLGIDLVKVKCGIVLKPTEHDLSDSILIGRYFLEIKGSINNYTW